MRLFDRSLAAQASLFRWIAEHDGTVVGFGGYEPLEQEPDHERKYQLHLFVSLENRGRGIGSSLYNQVMASSSLTNASLVRVWNRQDREESLRFLAARGNVA